MTAAPSRRHSSGDGTTSPLTSGYADCDGCDTTSQTRHTLPKPPPKGPYLANVPNPSHPTTTSRLDSRSADHATPTPTDEAGSTPHSDEAAEPASDAVPCPRPRSAISPDRVVRRVVTSTDVGENDITFRFPDQLPTLNRRASQILLAILVRLTEVEALDGPMEGDGHDC